MTTDRHHMSSAVPVIGALVLLAGVAAAPKPSANDADREAIRRVAYDYGEGYYEGSVARMARALDPGLVKRAILFLPGTGWYLEPVMTAKALVELTRQRAGRPSTPDTRQMTFTLLDLRRDIASAKVFWPGFNDYLHLAKQDGRWRIVQVLWTIPSPAAAAHRRRSIVVRVKSKAVTTRRSGVPSGPPTNSKRSGSLTSVANVVAVNGTSRTVCSVSRQKRNWPPSTHTRAEPYVPARRSRSAVEGSTGCAADSARSIAQSRRVRSMSVAAAARRAASARRQAAGRASRAGTSTSGETPTPSQLPRVC